MALFSLRTITLIVVLYLIDTMQARGGGMSNKRKRSGSCELRYKKIEPEHSACKAPSSQLVKSGVSSQDQKLIVDLHNEERRIVSPPASDMMAISWDEGLAKIAQGWASNCVYAHDKNYNRNDLGRFTVGQNLAQGQTSWTEAVKDWASEKQFYDYDSNSSPSGEPVGHFTQMVWATSVRVGCGFALCGKKRIYVCNYGPAGNMKGESPYTSGKSCGACSSTCNNKLCDCKDALCKNGGKMDPNTCTCACKPKFYKGADCSLNCDGGMPEPSHCAGWKVHCKTVSNVPQDCPKTCGWCGAAENA
ncbi:cysteine-rich venom protein-like [Mercenaria mercenaria]|uniref:cysteine-rich venom protein-like n=1 Tax=Mercenaria mercenaria TaxID=6596 RepID=UPI00234E8FDE|nr:cysteine-rich venom protein-like [Mercenaria mercenaria]